ncbi:UNVERIFIED_CONTAM: hypothetical protein Slati_2386600 [Sesamum latifolium]|uniref:DUF4216 domain-containing protein n=1 Tax=Sesamum latifolium TaxID=2727402 RepID=A0AAW2WE78_9LAMI
MPKANYTLTREQKRMICEWITRLKFSNGYASNLARCVDMKELRLHGMKSHDCHVFMQKLIPIAFREMLPQYVWTALIKVLCKHNRPSRNDDLAMNNTRIQQSIFNFPGRALYVYRLFFNELYEHYDFEDPIIEELVATQFKDWFKYYVKDEINYTGNKLLKLHYWGPTTEVTTFPCYFVNGYYFHTERHSVGKSTFNCGVCVKSSSYTDTDSDFYGILEEVIQLDYPVIPNMQIVLFKCRWVGLVRGVKVHPRYHLVDVNFKKVYRKNEPFIMAQQAVQV